jgi:hypothetical protein
MKLLGTANAKTVKGEKKGYMTFILYLAPSTESGYQTCPLASDGCSAACLFTSGMGRFDNVRNPRIRKTRYFFEDRGGFMTDLVSDIEKAIRQADRKEMTPCFRLNGTSDIRWETVPCERDGKVYPNVMTAFPDLIFYDYTKIPNRRNIPENYHLTFSRSESNDHHISTAIGNGMNVAVVVDVKKKDPIPTSLGRVFAGGFGPLPVVDGDETDLRFLDISGCIVGLRAKGDAKKDNSGFVVKVL